MANSILKIKKIIGFKHSMVLLNVNFHYEKIDFKNLY